MYELIEEYYRKNYNKLVLIVSKRTAAFAEDIVQESFVRAINQIDKFDYDIAQFSTWFAQQLNDRTKDFLRKERAQGFIAYDPDYTWDPLDEEILKDLYLFHDPKIDVSEIYECINKEKGRDKVVLLLSFEQGYTSKEISWIFKNNFSASGIRNILQRFKEKYNERLFQFTRKRKSKRVNQDGSIWQALREKISMDAEADIKRLLCRPKRQRYKRWKLLRSEHSVCRWRGPYGDLVIPILDNPKSIDKVKDVYTKEFLKDRRKTILSLRNT